METADLLDGLTPAQRRAVTTEAAPVCILASAGAGKTRVLTRRIAYRLTVGSATAGHTLSLTFTRKAATELRNRLAALGLREQVSAGTFHSLAAAQLQRWWADRRQTPPTLLDRKARLLGQLAGARPGLAPIPVAELASQIEWAKARMIDPASFVDAFTAEGRVPPQGASAAELAALYARYENEKVRRGLVDFDDLLDKCAGAIERDPEFAAAQRWRWRHLFVDEFQDLNPLQYRLLMAWLGSGTDLCVVGDPQQAIYGWNGADPGLLADIPRRWPTTEVVRLDSNHRCTHQIVAVAAAVLGRAGSHLRSSGREGPGPAVKAFPDEISEAAAIARGVRDAYTEGRPWGAMAVLARTNAQLIPIHKALGEAGVPCWAPSQSALLDDPAARRVLSDVRSRPHVPIQAVAADIEESLGTELPADELAVLAVLAELARAFAAEEPRASGGRWLGWLPAALGEAREGPDREGAVTLCSFHRAKGLEWEAVWISGLEEGLVPIGRAKSASSLAEERRLLYVALTRAATQLTCSWSRERTFGTRRVKRDPSPWLDLIEGATTPPPQGQVEAWRDRLAGQRRQLREASRRRRTSSLPDGWPAPDPELVGAIRAWRSETARASGVPAYIVLHDVTVEAIASLRPRTEAELLAVPGLGPVKAGRYGPSLISVVTARNAATATGGVGAPLGGGGLPGV